MKRILLVFYSQSGEADRIASLIETEMSGFGHSVTIARIWPDTEYPYPWGSISRFFDVMPETQLGLPRSIQRLHFDPEADFDLVILVSPVWFLAPALPMQGFFRRPESIAVLRDRPVMTVMVSRAMWQRGSEALKRLLAAAGARHVDNIVVTHRGSPVTSLISTPRALLSGKDDALMGVFPRAGVDDAEHTRIRDLARIAAIRLQERDAVTGSLLAGEPAVAVKRWLIAPEIVGRSVFRAWARLIRGVGRRSGRMRLVAVWAFAIFLPFMILVGLPLTLLATPILYLFARGWLERTAKQLAAPTGEMPQKRA